MTEPKRILYGVLNWGLGHATRSIPVIEALLKNGFEPLIASDGLALELLTRRFPNCFFLQLPDLNIQYNKSHSQVLALAKNALELRKWFKDESKVIAEFIAKEKVDGIISDNRPTIKSLNIPSAYLTHQIEVKAGIFSSLATLGHGYFFNDFSEIWVPDFNKEPKISGKLGTSKLEKVKYIGPLSDLNRVEKESKWDVAAILSGPEPQRTILENKIIGQLGERDLKITLLRGTNKEPEMAIPKPWKRIDLANRKHVQLAYSEAEVIISRCGYSTLMDLYAHPKPAILIPTPGQPEQEYLATLPLHKNNFIIQHQDELNLLAGLKSVNTRDAIFPHKLQAPNWKNLFKLFEE